MQRMLAMDDFHKALLEAFPPTAEDRRLYLNALRQNVVDVATEALKSPDLDDERKELIRWRLRDFKIFADRVLHGNAAAWLDWVTAEQIIMSATPPDMESKRKIVREAAADMAANARDRKRDKNAIDDAHQHAILEDVLRDRPGLKGKEAALKNEMDRRLREAGF